MMKFLLIIRTKKKVMAPNHISEPIIILEHSSTKNDVYSTDNLENDETEIELTPKTANDSVIGLSDDEEDENNDDPEVSNLLRHLLRNQLRYWNHHV